MIPEYHSDDFATACLEDTVSLRSAAREACASMDLEKIKTAVDAGNRVHWINRGYVVSDGRVSRFAKSISSTIGIKWGA